MKTIIPAALLIAVLHLCQAQSHTLWGMCPQGGSDSAGVIYSYDISTASYTLQHSFGSGADGRNPHGSLLAASDSLLYGLTRYGGTCNQGTIFSYNIATGAETVIHSFGLNLDGRYPWGTLIQASNHLLYGLTVHGGTNISNDTTGSGTIFSYDIATGAYNMVYSMDYGTGSSPGSSLIQASNGVLYGLVSTCGSEFNSGIFSYNIDSNTYNLLYFFVNCNCGYYIWGRPLQVNDSLLCGLNEAGGGFGGGAMFGYNILSGVCTDLHDFKLTENYSPMGSLIRANNGLLYAATSGGPDSGAIFSYNIATSAYNVVLHFGSATDGYDPNGSLFEASNGLLYGTTLWGGASSNGTVFSYNIATGQQTTVHDFNGADGAHPTADLIAANPNPIVIHTAISAQVKANNHLQISPNPSTGQFKLTLLNSANNYPVEVYNELGEKIYQSALNGTQNTINLSNQPAGMYLVIADAGENIATAKVIITK